MQLMSEETRKKVEEQRWVGISLIALVIVFVLSIRTGLTSEKQLDIVAYLDPVPTNGDTTWDARGRILFRGCPVEDATVWIIIKDASGNRASPLSDSLSNSRGEFTIKSIPRVLGGNLVTQATIYARIDTATDTTEEELLEGEEILSVAGVSTYRTVRLSVWALAFLPAIFFISMLIPFVRQKSEQAEYQFAIFLAFLFTTMMIVSISLGLSYVNSPGKDGQILSLGFATLFQGTYVEGVGPEWLFSLTAPPKQPGELATGFGAPLWVLLMAVIGAALLTVTIIVHEISDRAGADQYDQRIEKIVRHQFYILFSPLGAIFIYKALVIAQAAEQPLTVAIAALGAGATLNTLLQAGVEKAKQVFERQTSDESVTAGGISGEPSTSATGVDAEGEDSEDAPLAESAPGEVESE